MNDDPRFDRPMYALPEAARLLRLPRQTLRNWVFGYTYQTGRGSSSAAPVIETPGHGAGLSFVNLIEALTLSGFREMDVPMQRVRRALDYVSHQADFPHLLASERVLSDGIDLFWEFQERSDEHLVNISSGGQKAFPEAVMRYLREVEWGDDRFAERWWPGAEAPGSGMVVIDPRRSFGAPVIADTGIRVEDVFARFSAGDSIADLAHDYGVGVRPIEAAIRLEASLLERVAA